MRTWILTGLAALLVCTAGCLNVQVPREVNINGSDRVDSRTVPKTTSHEDCRAELNRAYARIRELEHDLQRCKQKNDQLEERLERYD